MVRFVLGRLDILLWNCGWSCVFCIFMKNSLVWFSTLNDFTMVICTTSSYKKSRDILCIIEIFLLAASLIFTQLLMTLELYVSGSLADVAVWFSVWWIGFRPFCSSVSSLGDTQFQRLYTVLNPQFEYRFLTDAVTSLNRFSFMLYACSDSIC